MAGNLGNGYVFRPGNTLMEEVYGAVPGVVNSGTTMQTTSATAVRVTKNFQAKHPGKIRVEFTLGRSATVDAHCQIYKNSVAHGTLRSVSAGVPSLFCSEDITVSLNDTVSVYAWCPSGNWVYVQDAVIKVENPPYLMTL